MGKWQHRIKDKNMDIRTGTCSICGPVKLAVDGRCRNKANEQSRKDKYKLKYNNPTAYSLRPNSCEICGGTTRIAYDHCHKTGIFRGWLCMKCNTVLGLVNDDPVLLKKLMDYLNKK